MSAVEVKTADTYKDDGHAYKQGLMDPHGCYRTRTALPYGQLLVSGESPGHFRHSADCRDSHRLCGLIKTALKATCNDCSNILLHGEPGTSPLGTEGESEQDYYRKRIRDVITKHGVGSTEFSKIIKEVEKVTTGTKRTLCMHCQKPQGKIVLDKPTTLKEKIEVQGQQGTDRKLNPVTFVNGSAGYPMTT